MTFLIDTSVLGRLANTKDADHDLAGHAVRGLNLRGDEAFITSQNLIEFRNVATRDISLNGLGLSIAEAEAQVVQFESTFSWLSETASIYPAWKGMVEALKVLGKQVHDARLVAVCHVNQVSHLLTFNVRHFTRFAAFGPGLVVVHPKDV